MKVLTQAELRSLIETRDDPCISVFIPTYRAGADIQQNPTALKNQLKIVESQLTARGWRTTQVESFLEPIQKLVADTPFWQEQSDGLAIFFSPQLFVYYRLPVTFDPQAVVGSRFMVKPLLPLFTGDGQFYLLALSQNEVRLFQGTRYSVSEINLASLPESLSQALWYESIEKGHRFVGVSSAPGGGSGQTAFQGRGGAAEESKKDRIKQYFRQINGALQPFLAKQNIPLILAGVEYLHPIYREVNSYPHLTGQGIIGNPEELSPQDLHQQAWQILQPQFEAEVGEAAGLYRHFEGTNRATTDLKTIVSASHYGRVEVLLMALGAQQMGTFDRDTGDVHLGDEANNASEVIDLVNHAARRTLLAKGSVYAIPPDQVPDGALMAAVLRY